MAASLLLRCSGAFQTRSLRAIRPDQKLLYLETLACELAWAWWGEVCTVHSCTRAHTRAADDARINDQQMAPAMSSGERWGESANQRKPLFEFGCSVEMRSGATRELWCERNCTTAAH